MGEPGLEELLERIRQLEAEIGRLRTAHGRDQAEIARLKEQLEQARRSGKRQAAPFSKGTVKAKPQRPGRKPGADYGKKGHRPPPESVDEICEAVLPDGCPSCRSSDIEWIGVQEQFQTEITRRPTRRKFNVHIGKCRCCGKRVQGRHPLQTSDALGAAASQIGPDAQAAAVFLNGCSSP